MPPSPAPLGLKTMQCVSFGEDIHLKIFPFTENDNGLVLKGSEWKSNLKDASAFESMINIFQTSIIQYQFGPSSIRNKYQT